VKYVVLVPDGCADEPLDELGGRTPLEAAHMPHLAGLAARSEVGRAIVIPPGFPPGSDVGHLSILGYDPAEFHTGRAPIEAAAMGVELRPGEVAYRCNLVTIDEAGTMVDFAAGHLTSEQGAPIVAALDAALGAGRNGIRFHPGVEYRHLCVVPSAMGDAACVPPHDLTGQLAVWPTGASAGALRELMDASREVVGAAARAVDSTATQIWLWGQGLKPELPRFVDRFGVDGRLTSAVDLVRGLGVLVDLEVLDVPGATAGFDNDYVAQRDAALASDTEARRAPPVRRHVRGEGPRDGPAEAPRRLVSQSLKRSFESSAQRASSSSSRPSSPLASSSRCSLSAARKASRPRRADVPPKYPCLSR